MRAPPPHIIEVFFFRIKEKSKGKDLLSDAKTSSGSSFIPCHCVSVFFALNQIFRSKFTAKYIPKF